MVKNSIKKQLGVILDYLAHLYPNPVTELNYSNAYQLLVAVILSAQCTDKRVNTITPALFAQFPAVSNLAMASVDEVFGYIRSCSYPNNKSKYLVAMARKLVNDFNGEVPVNVASLQTLPGVGRKTAHVIASVLDNQPVLAVDTHVFRVSKRLGLVPKTATTPLAVEKGLTAQIPKPMLPKAHHWFVLHGRYVCKAQRPNCADCGLKLWCSYYAAKLNS